MATSISFIASLVIAIVASFVSYYALVHEVDRLSTSISADWAQDILSRATYLYVAITGVVIATMGWWCVLRRCWEQITNKFLATLQG